MDKNLYFLIADKSDCAAIRKHYYVYATSLRAAWDIARNSPQLRGWTIRNVQPTSLGRRNGWQFIGGKQS
jgi:hypothetical protein